MIAKGQLQYYILITEIKYNNQVPLHQTKVWCKEKKVFQGENLRAGYSCRTLSCSSPHLH